MNTEEIRPIVEIDGLSLVGNYWFQLKEGQEAVVEIPPIPLRFIFSLGDFDDDGDPVSEVLPSDDPHTSKMVFRNMGKIGSVGRYATQHPGIMGKIGGKTIYLSYSLTRHFESVFVSLAIYAKGSDDAG